MKESKFSKSRRSKAEGNGSDGRIHLEGKRYPRLTENCLGAREVGGKVAIAPY